MSVGISRRVPSVGGAFVELHDLGVAHQLLDRVVMMNPYPP
jgi:hypothetical protein